MRPPPAPPVVSRSGTGSGSANTQTPPLAVAVLYHQPHGTQAHDPLPSARSGTLPAPGAYRALFSVSAGPNAGITLPPPGGAVLASAGLVTDVLVDLPLQAQAVGARRLCRPPGPGYRAGRFPLPPPRCGQTEQQPPNAPAARVAPGGAATAAPSPPTATSLTAPPATDRIRPDQAGTGRAYGAPAGTGTPPGSSVLTRSPVPRPPEKAITFTHAALRAHALPGLPAPHVRADRAAPDLREPLPPALLAAMTIVLAATAARSRATAFTRTPPAPTRSNSACPRPKA